MTLYEKGTKRIKNQQIRNTLQLDLAYFAVDQGPVFTRPRFSQVVNIRYLIDYLKCTKVYQTKK